MAVLTEPASNAVAVTPSDDTVFSPATRGIWVGTAGNLVVRMLETGTTITFKVPAGVMLPLRVTRILAATDADDIVAVW